jgi:cytochrome c-type biogenesis protein
MSLPVALTALFGAGVSGSLSPCVLPLVPGFLGVLVDGSTGLTRARRVAAFTCAAAATFAALGAAVAVAGAGATALLTSRVAGGVLLALALVALAADRGVLRLPQWQARVPVTLWLRPVALGVGCGAAWTPCVGPLLGAALTAAAGAGSAWRGGLLLFAFGLGVASPLLALSLLPLPHLPRRVRRLSPLVHVAVPLGLAVLGLLLLSGRYSTLVQRLAIGT